MPALIKKQIIRLNVSMDDQLAVNVLAAKGALMDKSSCLAVAPEVGALDEHRQCLE